MSRRVVASVVWKEGPVPGGASCMGQMTKPYLWVLKELPIGNGAIAFHHARSWLGGDLVRGLGLKSGLQQICSTGILYFSDRRGSSTFES
jgi:hypothetical protein